MRNVVVTGMGFVTCLGSDAATVSNRLRLLQHGIQVYPRFRDDPLIPVTVAAPIPGFVTETADPEDWVFPPGLPLRLEQLRSLSPNGLYAHFALRQAVADAGLELDALAGDPRTGLFTASSGSAMLMHHNLERMHRVGPLRCSPLGIVASIAGTLNFNLAAAYRIQGASTGFISACASSGHALGYAHDAIALGRQDRMVVVGAEDFTVDTIAPFAGMRVLSLNPDPDTASRPFDRGRDGFVGTGGSVVLVLEDAQVARQRGARVLAKFASWAQSTDGYHIAAAHPQGEGLARAMREAISLAGLRPDDIDYLNAHATSTQAGDIAECRAIRSVFGSGGRLRVSSTKALTGHALSLSSIMEAAFVILAMRDGFTPGSANIRELDPEAADLGIISQTVASAPHIALSNSSGFGGANVALVFTQPDA
jgi:3-oxoacyl-[acyl-carrier-protein] synthase I